MFGEALDILISIYGTLELSNNGIILCYDVLLTLCDVLLSLFGILLSLCDVLLSLCHYVGC